MKKNKARSFVREWLLPGALAILFSASVLFALGLLLQQHDKKFSVPPEREAAVENPASAIGVYSNESLPKTPEPPPSYEPRENLPPTGYVTTEDRSYQIPQNTASADRERRTLMALKQNCENAIRNNATGQYPAMQRQACNDYARHAQKMGFSVGDLPPAFEAPPPPQNAETRSAAPKTHANAAACASFYAEKRNIEARMRAGYGAAAGEHYRNRLRQLEDLIYRNGCRETGLD